MDAATQAAWDAGPYAKCLRDAKAANEALAAASQARLWDDPEYWFEPHDTTERLSRPTEYTALRRVFFACSGASQRWASWLTRQEMARYSGELAALQETVMSYKVIDMPVKAMSTGQLPLPMTVGTITAGIAV